MSGQGKRDQESSRSLSEETRTFPNPDVGVPYAFSTSEEQRFFEENTPHIAVGAKHFVLTGWHLHREYVRGPQHIDGAVTASGTERTNPGDQILALIELSKSTGANIEIRGVRIVPLTGYDDRIRSAAALLPGISEEALGLWVDEQRFDSGIRP